MKILVFAEVSEGKFKKSTLEAISYGANIAESTGGIVTALSIGDASNKEDAGKYGADNLETVSGSANFDDAAFSKAIADAALSMDADLIVISNTYSGKAVAPRVAVRTDAALISGAVTIAKTENGVQVKKSVFSGKAFASVKSNKSKAVIALTPNSIELKEYNKSADESASTAALGGALTEVLSAEKAAGKVSLTEAELVVSGGRGLKGPENWGLIEELADILGAATACSKPVSDMEWRPHSEHVGQTGITIKPNLYIAVGISGAIQHLAGVSSSKVIVVINKDPEAPFFKAADYGIVGDAFEVMPKLIEAAKSATA